MIKKILLGSLVLFSINTFSQESTASPYSFYGIGEIKFKGTVENRAMGGIGILTDSIHMNLQNPASLSALKLTTFTVAGTFTPTKIKNSVEEEKAQRTSFDYLAMSVPAGKLGLNFGLMPYSAVGYKVIKDEATQSAKYQGSGGLSRFFIGGGYQLSSKFSVGAEIAYNFGDLENSIAIFKPEVQFGSRELNKSKLSGLSFNTGVNFKTKIDKFNFVSSATFSPSVSLNSNNTRNTAKITYTSVGTERIWDSQDSDVADSNVKLPTRIAFGSGIGQDKKWFVGFESTFQSKGSYPNTVLTNASYESASKIAVGGYYIPKYNSFSSYLDKVTYRAGFRHESLGIIVNSESIKDSAVTLGLGFPISGNFSNINIGAEFGKRGTATAGLIQENYMNLSIGLSFNDRWFVKRKYD